jgi:Xaa-Pro aminopeptidase
MQYAGWQELFENIKVMLKNYRDVAMQYSPNNLVFTISLVDGGTLDLIRGLGKNVVSSGDLVAQFESTLTDEQIKSHFAARDSVDAITAAAFQEIGTRVRNGGTTEHKIQQWILEAFKRENLVTDDPPVVAVNGHSGDPHYGPHAETSSAIRNGDFVLLDIWGKKNTPGAMYYDITWTGFIGQTPSQKMREVFAVVRDARDVGIKTVIEAITSGRPIAGWEVDRATRNYINSAGYGDYFIHRTGHSIASDIHANGANMDDLEIHDERRILPNSCFSIEPGVYLPEFGVRSEINMLVNSSDDKKNASPAPVAGSISYVAPALGWLIPGAGHIIQKRWIRGGLLMASIALMFLLGVMMDGHVYKPNGGDILDILGFVGDLGAGALYMVARILGVGDGASAHVSADYGKVFIIVAGLLNFISVADAYHIAIGKKA